VPFDYEPHAAAPAQWLQFLRDVWPNDPEAISTLQEVFGYLLTPDTSQQKIFLIIGPKRSGKGTLARVLTEMLGAANVAGPSLASLSKDFGLQPLLGKQAAIVSDARLGGHADAKQVAENLLRISGEDRVDVARKNTSSISLRLGVRFVLLTNELPRIADASGAMASRFVILSMTESFIGREDPGLTGKLLRELPGVLAWAVEGWHRLKARGHFIEPKSSAGAAQELADLGSPIAAFVRDECVCGPLAQVETGALFLAWRTWCARQGMPHAGTLQTFGRDLHAAFPSIVLTQRRVGGDRERFYRGVALLGVTQCHAFHPIASQPAQQAPGLHQ
jgi:putative DNA primase/helicase